MSRIVSSLGPGSSLNIGVIDKPGTQASTFVTWQSWVALAISKAISARVGTVLLLEQPRTAREMLGGGPHKRGKIGLTLLAGAAVVVIDGWIVCRISAGYRLGSRGQGDAANDAGTGGNRWQRGHDGHGGVRAGRVERGAPAQCLCVCLCAGRGSEVSRNANTTKPAKFLVFFVKQKGAPTTVPAK